jgi:hypothetical protein
MKNLFKIIFLSLLINSLGYCEVIVKSKYNDSSNNPMIGLKDNIADNLKDLNYSKDSFFLSGRCIINSRGNLSYKLISESKSGYDNKVLIVQELERIKKIGFKEEREQINKIFTDYEYKDIVFDFEISQE